MLAFFEAAGNNCHWGGNTEWGHSLGAGQVAVLQAAKHLRAGQVRWRLRLTTQARACR